MKKIIVASVFALLSLTACGSDTGQEALDDATSEQLPEKTVDSVFVNVIRDGTDSNVFTVTSNGDLVSLAHKVCEGLDADLSIWSLGEIFVKNNISAHDAGFFMGAAVQAYCPEHKDVLDSDSGL